MEIIAEEWRDVPGYEGYQVSRSGEVRSVDRIVMRSRQGPYPVKGKKLRSRVCPTGYLTLNLGLKGQGVRVHAIVAAAFIGERPNGFSINHIDGVKTNNVVENLEYVTPSENTQHAYRIGLASGQRGKDSHRAKICEGDVREIRRLAVSGSGSREIARKFGLSNSGIKHILSGRSWSHVT